MKPSRFLLAALMLSLLVILSCRRTSPPKPEKVLSKSRITLTNNAAYLAMRVKYYPDTEISLDTTGAGPNRGKTIGRFRLKLRAEVSPPVVDGITIQATHVAIAGSHAYVSYNVRGETYLGGIEVIDVSTKANPRLISQAVLEGTDVSAVAYDNGKLYLAEATSDTGFTYPAVVEEIALQNNMLTIASRRVGVASYVATDVEAAGGKVFAASGSGGPGVGGLTVLDRNSFQILTADRFLDARSIDTYRNGVIVMQGTPGQIRLYDSATALSSTYTIGGASIPESKSTVVVVLDRAFVAAGDEGLKVVDLSTGGIIDSIPRVTIVDVNPNLTVTNAASVNKDLVFTANGQAGVHVAQAEIDWENVTTGSPALSVLGRMQLGSGDFANYVASADNILFIASGLGGLKIVEIEYDSPSSHVLKK